MVFMEDALESELLWGIASQSPAWRRLIRPHGRRNGAVAPRQDDRSFGSTTHHRGAARQTVTVRRTEKAVV